MKIRCIRCWTSIEKNEFILFDGYCEDCYNKKNLDIYDKTLYIIDNRGKRLC